MKKTLILLTTLGIALSMAGCSDKKDDKPVEPTPTVEPTDGPEEIVADIVEADPNVSADMMNMVDSVYKGIDDAPKYIVSSLTEENFEYYTFTEYTDKVEAVTADAMISAIPHSVVIVRALDESVDLEAMAEEMKTNADLAKWVCVEAETAKTAVADDYLLFVMSSEDMASAMVENFNNTFPEAETK